MPAIVAALSAASRTVSPAAIAELTAWVISGGNEVNPAIGAAGTNGSNVVLATVAAKYAD